MLDRIRILAQVVESGSFSRAARALNQAPSSVTRAIDALEQQLGIPLFKRSTRQLVLTEQGAYFLARSLPLLEEADQLVQSLQPLSVAPEGPLRVSVFESFGASWLSPRLPDFLARYPGVRLEVALDNRVVDLDAENVDVAVRIGKPSDSSLHTRHLLTNRSLLVASPAYLARHGEPAHPAELAHHNCLIRGHGRQRQHWYFQQGTEREKVAVQGNLASVGARPCSAPPSRGAACCCCRAGWCSKASTRAPCCRCCQSGSPPPTRIARTRSTRCFVAAASSNPRPAPSSTFWSRRSGPCKGRADRNRASWRSAENADAGHRARRLEMRVATATAQRDFRPSGLGESPR